MTDGYADTPPGTNGDHANNLVVDIGGGRYVVLAHLKQGSVTVQVGDVVRRGQPLAAVGNTGHTNEPHLHLQIQDSPTGKEDADRTYPMAFRNVHITRGGPWPLGDSRAASHRRPRPGTRAVTTTAWPRVARPLIATKLFVPKLRRGLVSTPKTPSSTCGAELERD